MGLTDHERRRTEDQRECSSFRHFALVLHFLHCFRHSMEGEYVAVVSRVLV